MSQDALDGTCLQPITQWLTIKPKLAIQDVKAEIPLKAGLQTRDSKNKMQFGISFISLGLTLRFYTLHNDSACKFAENSEYIGIYRNTYLMWNTC